mmetsp:Transcript_39004/g.62280  ORF Transcript_39004/g.62280 Transcript_39004/m.62280 type:complete len:194 (+) Transcript_39004:45-626(+)
MAPTQSYLVEKLSFYAAYHSVFGNQLVHFIFIPAILVTSLSLCNIYLPPASYKVYEFGNDAMNDSFPISVSLLVFAAMYPLSYIYIDLIAGISWIPMSIFSWWMANYVEKACSAPTIWLIFAISWIAQFLAHGLIERRRPALIDSLYESLVLAPFFWWFEVFLFPLGFYSDTKRQMAQNAKKIQKKIDAVKQR